MFRSIAVLLAAVALMSCGRDVGDGYDDVDADTRAEAAADAAEDARQAVYSQRGADSNGRGSETSAVDADALVDSGNYVCTQDCSGHEAGFAWARDNDIDETSECGGNSDSFVEGCEAFAQARQEEADRQTQEAAEQAAEEAAEAVGDEETYSEE